MAPWPAALLEKKTIKVDRIMQAYKELARRHSYMVVEGVGGLLVPLTRTFFVSDLIHKLRLPALIVTRPDLGMLNHTLLTIRELKRKEIPLAGVVINNYVGKTRAERSNPHVLRRILDRRILVVPHQPRFVSDFDSLARLLIKQGLFNLPFLP